MWPDKHILPLKHNYVPLLKVTNQRMYNHNITQSDLISTQPDGHQRGLLSKFLYPSQNILYKKKYFGTFFFSGKKLFYDQNIFSNFFDQKPIFNPAKTFFKVKCYVFIAMQFLLYCLYDMINQVSGTLICLFLSDAMYFVPLYICL